MSWEAFEEALETTFSEPNPITSATNKLDNLTMKDTHHITQYNVEFNKYTAITGFDKQALYTKYYKGLTPHIKDGLVFSSQPNKLSALCTKAQALDLHYWEHHNEDCLKDKPAATPSPKFSGGSTPTSTSSKPTTSSSSEHHSKDTTLSASSSKCHNHMHQSPSPLNWTSRVPSQTYPVQFLQFRPYIMMSFVPVLMSCAPISLLFPILYRYLPLLGVPDPH